MKQNRIYVDTSVIGGCFDHEFQKESHALMEMANNHDVILLISDLLFQELELAPGHVQDLFGTLPPSAMETNESSTESRALRDAYIHAGVVGKKHLNDAHHVALATLAHADLIVSWNFKHIVHFDKIKAFNGVNLQQGYP